jgi:transposase
MIALTQLRHHEPAKRLYQRRRENGDGGMEALRILKRRLSNVVFNAMKHDQTARFNIAT